MWPLNRLRESGRLSSNNGRKNPVRTLTHATSVEAPAPHHPPAAELQQDVQRAATAFMDRASQAADPLEKGNRPVNEEALLRRILLYNASVLEIATGPFPEVNALDMLVFAALARGALERHWIPTRFGEEGAPLIEACDCLEHESWETAAKFLDRRQRVDLRELITAWQDEHPDQYRVEGVRFQEFSEHAGQIESERTKKARGLLGHVKSATMAADQALVISERAFFVAHRMPFLLRAQARLGVQETLSDSLARLNDVEALLGQVRTLRPFLDEVVTLSDNARAAIVETRLLAQQLEPHIDRITKTDGAPREGQDPVHMLESANRLTESSISLVRELRGAVPDDPARTIAAIEERVDRALRRWILYVLAAAVAWAAFFWCAYFMVRRL
jgi:hypothetical protein